MGSDIVGLRSWLSTTDKLPTGLAVVKLAHRPRAQLVNPRAPSRPMLRRAGSRSARRCRSTKAEPSCEVLRIIPWSIGKRGTRREPRRVGQAGQQTTTAPPRRRRDPVETVFDECDERCTDAAYRGIGG